MQANFHKALQQAQHVCVMTGAGVSAESGVPTFRGAGGLWRSFDATELATPQAFKSQPSLVWEFYHYRRELVRQCTSNPAHFALVELEKKLLSEDKQFTLVTQNVDGLHLAAGSQNVIEIHGALRKVRCLKCGIETVNNDSPICEALRGKGAPDQKTPAANIPLEQLPRCSNKECGGLLRPAVVWFGENLDPTVLQQVDEAVDSCDLFIVCGTSAVVYPAAGYIPYVKQRQVPVAEFNIEQTPVSRLIDFMFVGKAGEQLPLALNDFLKE